MRAIIANLTSTYNCTVSYNSIKLHMKQQFQVFKSENVISFIVFSLITLSLFLRMIKLITREDYFGGDFAFYYFLTKSIAIDHKLPLIGHVVGDIGGFAQGAGWNYLLITPFILANGHPYGAKAMMFSISVMIIFLSWFLFKNLLKSKELICTVFLLSVSPNLITWSTAVWPPYVVPLLSVAHIGFLGQYLKTTQKKYFLLSTASLVLIIHFEIASFGILLASYLLLTAYLLHRKQLTVQYVFLAALLFFITFLPHIVYDIFHNFYNLKGLLTMLFFHRTTLLSSHIFEILTNRYYIIKTDLLFVFPPLQNKLLFIFLLIFIFGTFLYFRDRKNSPWEKKLMSYLLTTIILTFTCLIVFPALSIPFWWFTYLTIFYLLWIGIIVGYFLSYHKLIYKAIAIIFLSLTLLSSFHELSLLLEKEKRLRNVKYVIKIEEPIEYIYSDSKGKPFKVLFATGLVKVQDYKYMLWYIGKEKYKNSQGFKLLDLSYAFPDGRPVTIQEANQFKDLKKGTYYVIITQQSLQSGYAQKILNQETSGKLITKKKFETGYVVEKRIVD